MLEFKHLMELMSSNITHIPSAQVSSIVAEKLNTEMAKLPFKTAFRDPALMLEETL